MRRKPAVLLALVLFLMCAVMLAACGGGSDSSAKAQANAAHDKAKESGENFVPYIPPEGNTEQTNYNKAQELYNAKGTILWCTVYPQSSTAPIVTVPVAGKLTSSTTTAFNPEEYIDRGNYSWQQGPARSVDGLYHPNPPPYRYGFTPGGQYVDFFNLPTLCTTQPMEFQRTSVSVEVNHSLADASKEASKALAAGEGAKAQQILKAAASE